MNDNFFLDTNILFYCYTVNEPEKQAKAVKIAKIENTFISTQVLTEFSNILSKKFNLDWQSIRNVITELSNDFNVYINQPQTIELACRIAEKYHYSFYDSLIIAAAISCNCRILYSEDMQDGQMIEDTLKIVNPL